VIARLKAWAAVAALVVAGLVASWFGGRKAAKTDTKIKGLEDYVDTRGRIDQVVRDNDGADVTDWLRDRGKQ